MSYGTPTAPAAVPESISNHLREMYQSTEAVNSALGKILSRIIGGGPAEEKPQVPQPVGILSDIRAIKEALAKTNDLALRLDNLI